MKTVFLIVVANDIDLLHHLIRTGEFAPEVIQPEVKTFEEVNDTFKKNIPIKPVAVHEYFEPVLKKKPLKDKQQDRYRQKHHSKRYKK
jgi:hypothetical protein